MGKILRKNMVISLIICIVMTTTAFAGSSRQVKYTYESNNGNYTAGKLSHPENGPKEDDGIIDFENGDADIGQNYSWSSVGYGKYMYIGTCYGAMYNTMKKMAYELNMELSELKAIVNVLYNGTLYVGDEKNNPEAQNRAVIVKLNTETLEVSIIEPPKNMGGYRASIEFKDKLYFSATGTTPYLLEIDPKTDETKVVYKSQKPSSPSISTGIRGLTVVGDELIASMIGDNGAYIVSSTEPSKGESSFKTICTQEDLLDYPAYLYTDSIFGGSIWDMVCFNNKLYFTVVTGKNGDKSSFAMFRGENDENGKWTFEPIIGKEEDNTKYPLGLGASRSGAANLEVYNNHLYIGGYNDPMIALSDVLNFNFENLYKDLSEPVNLWRMDKSEDIELVAGEPNKLFSKRVGNQTSGFGSSLNQYVWDMEVYQGKLYLGTFNIGSLAYPIMQFTNGDVLDMTKEEIESQIKYIKELIEILSNKQNSSSKLEEVISEETETEEISEETINKKNVNEEDNNEENSNKDIDIKEETISENINEESVVKTSEKEVLTQENEKIIDSLEEMSKNLEVITEELDSTYEDNTSNRSISEQEIVLKCLEDAKKIYEEYKDELSEESIESLDKLLNKEKIQNFKYFIESCKYLSKGQRGFSLLVSEDGKNFETITNDGFSDPYNHGLRTFSKTTTGLTIGTANPFKGTQVWKITDNNADSIKDSIVDNNKATYDKYKKEEVAFKIRYNGNTLESVQKDYKSLTEGTEYTLKDEYIVFSTDYLDTLDLGTHEFRFRFSNNGFVDVKVEVIDSSSEDTDNPEKPNDTTKPNNNDKNESISGPNNIQTGDDSGIVILTILSVCCLVALFILNRKNRMKS